MAPLERAGERRFVGGARDRCSNLHRFQMKRQESMIGLSRPARAILRSVPVIG